MAKVDNKKATTKKTASPVKPVKIKSAQTSPSKKVTAKKTEAPKRKPTVKKALIENPEIMIVEEINEKLCTNCNANYATELMECPFCYNKKKVNRGPIIMACLILLLLVGIIGSHFLEKHQEEQVSEAEYKYNCELVPYEDIVRSPKDYKNKDIKMIGQVLKVEGTDLGYGNKILVTLDVNLFDGPNAQLVEFEYIDKSYDMGLMKNDIITIYGKYTSINGNKPYMKVKYIVLGT